MKTKLSPNISLGSPIALAVGCFTLFPNTRYIPHATNHKNTTATEKIKCAMRETLQTSNARVYRFFCLSRGFIS
ncbi:hypothetical protein [Helicobacter pylori]|uniref:hypothetical protein n=1 Tax=Helicobacter pylori TaxID=210 RepID=UPI003CC88ED5